VEVWHLLLGVLLAVVIADMAAAAFVVWWTHRRPVGTAPPQTAVPVKKQTPFVISDKVRWEDTGNYLGGGMQVYGPLCPKDYTPLRYVNHRSTWGESKTEGIGENDLVGEYHGSLICLTCDETYYFNGEGPGKTVELARAEARTRLYGMRNRDET